MTGFSGQREGLQLLQRAVEDIEVGLLVYPREDGTVGVLPEQPVALIARMRHVVMGYPQGIAIELGDIEVAFLEFIGGIDDGTDAIVRLQAVEEDGELGVERRLLQTRRRFLHIDDGGQVALLQLHVADEEVGLNDGVGGRIVEVIGAPDEALLAGSGEVIVKKPVLMVASLRSLDEDKTDGDVGLLKRRQLLPVDIALMMRDVDAVNGIAVGNADVIGLSAIGGAVQLRTDEKPPEEEQQHDTDQQRQHATASRPLGLPALRLAGFPAR